MTGLAEFFFDTVFAHLYSKLRQLKTTGTKVYRTRIHGLVAKQVFDHFDRKQIQKVVKRKKEVTI